MGDAATVRWTIESRIGYPLFMEVAPSPNGRKVLYVVREPLMTDDKSEFISHLYLASSEDGEPIQLTFGDARNTSPRWSADGRHVAFLSNRSGKMNVHVLRTAGGEAWPLTRYDKTDVAALKWSPDGRRIGFLMAEPPTEEKEKARKARNDAIQFDVDFEFARLYTVPFAVAPRTLPEVTQITRGQYHVAEFEWLRDGRQVAITHRPNPGADEWTETRLAIVAADGGSEQPTDLGLVATSMGAPKASPDGRWIACDTSDQPPAWASSGRIVLYAADGSGRTQPLSRTPDGQSIPVGWSTDRDEFVVVDASGATAQLWVLPLSGAAPRQLTDSALLKSLAAMSDSGQIAFVGQDFDRPNAVYLLDSASGRVSKVAQPPLPTAWPEAPLPRAEVIRWQAPDGLEIEGILVYPLEYQPGQRYPLIVEVHGGPTGVYARSYLGAIGSYADTAGLAERGFAILRANPRGSTGYGREFRFANYHDWGGGDYRDIMAGVDHLIEQGIADADRLGILGWSYGGFMTSWVITQTHRFKAACVGAGVADPISFTGTTDIAGFIPDYFGAEFWDDLEAYRRHTPVLHAQGVTTPTLIQHGEQDVRVPLGQGRELYNALKRQGVPVEMVIYPRQGHGIEEPRLLLDVRRRAIAWFERWLRP